MKRDMDLIRELLLKLEDRPLPSTGIEWIAPDRPDVQVPGYGIEQISYHLSLLEEAGFVDAGEMGFGIRSGPGIAFRRLSWTGHDFLETVRSPDVWAKTKAGALAAGGFTVQLLADLAKGFIKKQIEDRTGVKL